MHDLKWPINSARIDAAQLKRPLAVEERAVSLAEIKDAARCGRMLEIFGTGTAVVCQPVSSILFPGDVAGG